MKTKNIYSHLTAKERTKLSFPMNWLKRNNLLSGDILDFGCGYGTDVEFLKNEGYNISGYDPYYFNNYPQQKFDTITCIYVLNVLTEIEQSKVLLNISKLLKSGGKAYFVVRRDIKYEGFRTHKVYKKQTYQCNVVLNFKSIFKNTSCEIYEYQHFNQILRQSSISCPFCNPNFETKIIAEIATAYAIYDKYPVNKGHALIIPKRHIANYFDLSFKEQSAINLLLNDVEKELKRKFNPDGFNIGVNINEVAGQTIPHVHIHLIPRYKNDVENPVGGVRNIIPFKGDYISNKNIWE